jgi:hypothetical protein
MSTITREWLQQAINDYESVRDEIPFGLDDYQGNILAALRIALASLEAEPVAYVDPFAFNNFSVYRAGDTDNKRMGREWMWANPDAGLIPVYTAPPAPVSVPDAMDDQGGVCCEVSYADGWNACRAAMLQSFGNSEQLNSPVIPDAYDIKAFGIFSATEGENGLMMEVDRFHFETDSCPKIGKDEFVPKFAIQAIINRLQKHCDNMEADALVNVLSTSAAPQQEVK